MVLAMGLTMVLAVAVALSVALAVSVAVALALTVLEIMVAASPARAGRVGRGGVCNRRCGDVGVVGVGMVVAAVVAAMFGEEVVHGEFKVQGLGNARDATEVDADIQQVGQARPAPAEPPAAADAAAAAAAKAESHGTARVATVLGRRGPTGG